MDIPQPVLKVVAAVLSVGILVELAILTRITRRSREEQADWDPGTGRSNTSGYEARDDGDEKAGPQRDKRMPPVDHTL
ncbi:hypothetical protein CGRA01v4_08392 [Colletotrichum graminicola]|uniref:Uncharacterized protein n=1 Tax=Colletotrichum graminicola (strain M1.001 / M2 / FGSC 10212) TaxID=645133 RepID=E3QMC3_COLGM|nr:uncharacterized protein GLRG_07155 [Colletotrichum graminicola M1.001]EFQ32011.1 hypothetical protein GLRG_07155 [Colletotrichum graminicola M1.001]WDK17109.1 hypothetical protein CGRA01v4_08392 [Colletotrichum graminicola]